MIDLMRVNWGLWLRLGRSFVLLLACAVWGLAQSQPAGVRVYFSDASVAFWAAKGVALSLVQSRWRRALVRHGGDAHLIERAELLTLTPGGTLVLPMADVLDAQERSAITRFAQGGGSVLATGALGARNQTEQAGQAPDYSFLQTLFGVQVQGFYSKTDDVFFMPMGDGPLTWPIPAMRRMPLISLGDGLLRLQGAQSAAMTLDWARAFDPQPHAAMVFSEVGRSRRVLLGFPDYTWPDTPDTKRVIDATLAWLQHVPYGFIAAWPRGYLAAHLIEMDTEDKFPSAVHLASQLEAIGARGTFYSLTSEAIQAPDVVADLLHRGHEMAYHADVHFGFKGTPEAEQGLRMAFMKQQLGSLLGSRLTEATGFRAPTESYDMTTERLLRRYGILHHAADESATEDRLPFFSNAEPSLPPTEALVVLPRTQLDDISFNDLHYSPAQITQALIRDLDETVRSGAFGLLSVHSQNYVDGGLMRLAMLEYLPHVAAYKDRLWVARGDAITHWWRQRAQVQLSQNRIGEVLSMTLNSPISVQDLTVMVTLPQQNAPLQIRVAPSSASVRVRPVDAWRNALVFDTLPAGQTVLQVKFAAPSH